MITIKMKATTSFILGKYILQKFRLFFFYLLSNKNNPNVSCKKIQPLLILGEGTIYIPASTIFGVYKSPGFFNGYAYLEARDKNSSISIGDNCSFNNNPTIIAEKSIISIGNNCLFGNNVYIIDSDFHPTGFSKAKAKKVTINNNVFIGTNTTILKGVTIGKNSIIGAGSVVSKSIPSNVIAAGNPCRVIKKIRITKKH